MLLTLFLLVVTVIGGRGILPAFADTTTYSNVLTDLQKDSNFNIADYPDDSSDYSIQVIQIAESTNGELFVYTYQPCQKTQYVLATEVNMSLSKTVDGSKLYGLTLINVNGVFGKYKVNDFTVSTEAIRYYNITSIYRYWIEGIDNNSGNDNTKKAVAFEVGKCYKATTENGGVSYSCEYLQTVKIKNPYHDFLRYKKGVFWFMNDEFVDSHYIAFSTNLPIDKLISATVSYYTQDNLKVYWGTEENLVEDEYGDIVSYTETLTDKDTGNLQVEKPLGLFYANNTEFSRIQSVEEFLKGDKYIKPDDFEEETKNNLNGKQWVLRFTETEYSENIEQGFCFRKCTVVSEVTVLRLGFEMDGKTYNLGAISDKVSGDDKPGNKTGSGFDFWAWLAEKLGIPVWAVKLISSVVIILIVLAVVLLILSAVSPAVSVLLKNIAVGLITFLKYLIIGLWWLICLPFKGIAALVQKARGE